MFTNRSTIPIKLGILLVGFGLLVVGCDSTGTGNGGEQDDEAVTFKTVDGLGDRITYADDNSTSNAKSASPKSPSFTVTSRVKPQSNNLSNAEASHLALSSKPNGVSNRNLYIAYKQRGDAYGGGVDILDAPSGDAGADDLSGASENNVNSARDAIQSSDVDVQELAVKENTDPAPDALYLAAAVDPPANVSRAPQFHSIQLRNDDGLPNSGFEHDELELDASSGNATTRIAKSVVASNSNNNSFDAFTVTDATTAHAIGMVSDNYVINQEGVETAEGTGSGYRSVTETADGTFYALGFGGKLYEFDGSSMSSFGPDLGSLSNTNSIARLSSHDFANATSYPFQGENFLFAALNDGGFAVVNTSLNGSPVVYEDADPYATAVAVTDNYVYVANGDGFAIYEVEDNNGLRNDSDTKKGLDRVGQQNLEDMASAAGINVNDDQVNDIVVDGSGSSNNIIYVAKSTSGVYKIEQDDSWP